jgi:hypothetical protein
VNGGPSSSTITGRDAGAKHTAGRDRGSVYRQAAEARRTVERQAGVEGATPYRPMRH